MTNQRDVPVRVVVVDDSRALRRFLTDIISRDPDLDVVGEAGCAMDARRVIRDTDPDVVTLDIEMPDMNGLDFLRKIMALKPTPVLMVSSLTDRGADASLAAMEIGAVDALAKPVGLKDRKRFGAELRTKILDASQSQARHPVEKDVRRDVNARAGARNGKRVSLIAIGASTGGVGVLSTILGQLPPTAPPVVISQHMPPQFTARLAARLNEKLLLDIKQAQDGEHLRRGMVRIAPGQMHMKVRNQSAGLTTELLPAVDGAGPSPSVDIMFQSVADAVGPRSVGVILTGMGRDGANGLLKMCRGGAVCLGQSRESCVVYGMPAAAHALGATQEELDPSHIAERLCAFVNGFDDITYPSAKESLECHRRDL